MISVKTGTKTWSDAPQVSSLKGDGKKTVAADKVDQVLGTSDLGEYLNKVADPNWVDPRKARAVGNDQLDKDAFLKLFLAQLKNQDPTNTMDSHQLAAQLAQFSSLEKLGSIDEGINGLSKKTGSQGQYEVLSLVGKKVVGDSSRIIRNDSKEAHDISFQLPSDAAVAELSIRNANGQEVRKLEARGLKAGPNKVLWNGSLENGRPADVGEYNVVISAKTASGQKLAVNTQFEGLVSGVSFTSQGPVLKVGQQTLRMSDIKGVSDPKLEELVSQVSAASAHSPQQVRSLQADSPKPTRIAGMGGNLDSIGMQQGLINKIEKEAEKTLNNNTGEASNTEKGKGQ